MSTSKSEYANGSAARILRNATTAPPTGPRRTPIDDRSRAVGDRDRDKSMPDGELEHETRIVAKRLCGFLGWYHNTNPPDVLADRVIDYYGDDIRLAVLLAPSHRVGCTTGFRAALACFIANETVGSEALDHLADIAQVVNGNRTSMVARLSGRCERLLMDFQDLLAKPKVDGANISKERYRFMLSMRAIGMYLSNKKSADLSCGNHAGFDPTTIPIAMLCPFDGHGPEAATH